MSENTENNTAKETATSTEESSAKSKVNWMSVGTSVLIGVAGVAVGFFVGKSSN